MKRPVLLGVIAGATALVLGGASLAVGNYVYTSGTVVPCAINEDDLANTPERFTTPGSGKGPFSGEGWEKWVGHDISKWWMTATYEAVTIQVAEGIDLPRV